MTADALQAELRNVPVATILTEVATRKLLVVNDAAAQLFGAPAPELLGTDVASHVHPAEQEAVKQAYAVLAAHVVDGYQVTRRVVKPDGTELTLNVWGRRIDTDRGPLGLWVLTSQADGQAVGGPVRATKVVLALTDHDWQLGYVSADAHLLGGRGSTLVGTPLLGLVHPSAAPEFLAAAARAVTNRLAVTVLTRLRAASDRWDYRYCLLVPMCEHEPPRLGVVVTPIPSGLGPSGSTIDPHVQHCALEARAAHALGALPAIAHHPGAADLSARQVEILSRLIAGEGIEDIARSLYLSPSTVRNHLTAIYRKFGVHSRAELLAELLRAASIFLDELRR